MTEILANHTLDNIPFQPDLPVLMKRLRVKPDSADAAELACLVETARQLARPKALYLEAFVGERGADWVVIGGVLFTSRVLRVNLEQAYRVFPYLATCGIELQEWAAGITDVLFAYWAEAVKEAALLWARQALDCHLEERYRPGRTGRMSPGSLPDWPIQEQCGLFELFGPLAGQIGVVLTGSMLMLPTKTVSGICFPTEIFFENCQLCTRVDCPGRRAPYDPQIYASRYRDS